MAATAARQQGNSRTIKNSCRISSSSSSIAVAATKQQQPHNSSTAAAQQQNEILMVLIIAMDDAGVRSNVPPHPLGVDCFNSLMTQASNKRVPPLPSLTPPAQALGKTLNSPPSRASKVKLLTIAVNDAGFRTKVPPHPPREDRLLVRPFIEADVEVASRRRALVHGKPVPPRERNLRRNHAKIKTWCTHQLAKAELSNRAKYQNSVRYQLVKYFKVVNSKTEHRPLNRRVSKLM